MNKLLIAIIIAGIMLFALIAPAWAQEVPDDAPMWNLPVKPPTCSLGQALFGNCAEYKERYNQQMMDWASRQQNFQYEQAEKQADRDMVADMAATLFEQNQMWQDEMQAQQERMIAAEVQNSSGAHMAQVAEAALNASAQVQVAQLQPQQPQVVYVPSNNPSMLPYMLPYMLVAVLFAVAGAFAFWRAQREDMQSQPMYLPRPQPMQLDVPHPIQIFMGRYAAQSGAEVEAHWDGERWSVVDPHTGEIVWKQPRQLTQ